VSITNYSSRFWLFAPLALFLALAAWAMGYWWVAASALDKRLTALNGHAAAPGITLSYDTKTISGFPFNIDVVFTGFTVSGRGAHGPFRWHADRFALHRLTYGAVHDIYEAAGNQTLSWTDASGGTHMLHFLPGSLRASAIADAKGLSRFDLDLVDAGGTDTDGKPFTIAEAQFHLRRHPHGNALDLMLSADAMKRAGMALFGDEIRTFRLYATLMPGAPLEAALAGGRSWAEAAADFRAQGGKADIGQVEIVSTGLNLSAAHFADADGSLKAILSPLY